jgi:hypothetical protein
MTVGLVMNAVHTHWSGGNECDLGADIGTRIASSLSYTGRVERGGTNTGDPHAITGFHIRRGNSCFGVNQMKCLN